MGAIAKNAQEATIVPVQHNPQPPDMLGAIIRAACNPDLDPAKMERMLEMHDKLRAQQAEQAFSLAMSQAQAEIGRIAADRRNKQTNSDYASYAAIDRVLRPIYTSHGFALSFGTGQSSNESELIVLCDVMHRDGHTKRYTIPMPADGKGAKGGDVMTKTHATGSAATYGMRYLLKLIFNVAIGDDPDDDDGNGADNKPSGDTKEIKARDWIRHADAIQSPQEYEAARARMLADYGGNPNSVPRDVRAAFNKARAAVMPKDEA